MKLWFYRLSAAHFIVTALTGLLLYFRPGRRRPGIYSDEVKEWLVMIHNGEWISSLLLGSPFYSGIVIGLLLSFALIGFSIGSLRRR